MFDWPEATQTSPINTSLSVISSALHLNSSGPPAAGVAIFIAHSPCHRLGFRLRIAERNAPRFVRIGPATPPLAVQDHRIAKDFGQLSVGVRIGRRERWWAGENEGNAGNTQVSSHGGFLAERKGRFDRTVGGEPVDERRHCICSGAKALHQAQTQMPRPLKIAAAAVGADSPRLVARRLSSG